MVHRKVPGRWNIPTFAGYFSKSGFIIKLYLDKEVLKGTSRSSPVCCKCLNWSSSIFSVFVSLSDYVILGSFPAVFSKAFYLKLHQYPGKVSKPGFYSGLSQAIKVLKTPSLLGGEGKKGPWTTVLGDFWVSHSSSLRAIFVLSETHGNPRVEAKT